MNVASRNPVKKKIVLGLCAIAAVWAIGCAVIYSEMRKPPEEFGRFMARRARYPLSSGHPHGNDRHCGRVATLNCKLPAGAA